MLDLSISIEGNKVLIDGLDRFSEGTPAAPFNEGLTVRVSGSTEKHLHFLSGAGAKGVSHEVASKKTGKTYLKWEKQSVPAGGYPVPVRTGNLRSHLNLLLHGQRKSDEFGSFGAGAFENILYDSVPYSIVVHEGIGTSAEYGPRRYVTDALERFNQGDRIKGILEEEIRKARGK